jgi:hypothetical protein
MSASDVDAPAQSRNAPLPRKRQGRGVPVTSLFELHLVPVDAGARVFTTAQHNDPINPP